MWAMVEWGFWEWRGWQRGDGITHGSRLLPGKLEEWSQGQEFLPLQCPSGKVQRESQCAKVLTVLVGTSEGYEWVAAQWWETITMIAPSRRT